MPRSGLCESGPSQSDRDRRVRILLKLNYCLFVCLYRIVCERREVKAHLLAFMIFNMNNLLLLTINW